MAELGGEVSVRAICIVVEIYKDELVRHETTFSLERLSSPTEIIIVGKMILNNSLNGVNEVKINLLE